MNLNPVSSNKKVRLPWVLSPVCRDGEVRRVCQCPDEDRHQPRGTVRRSTERWYVDLDLLNCHGLHLLACNISRFDRRVQWTLGQLFSQLPRMCLIINAFLLHRQEDQMLFECSLAIICIIALSTVREHLR